MAEYTKDNRFEIPNQKPVALPVGYEKPESLESMIARMVRIHSKAAEVVGMESFEEADDFEVGDEEGELGLGEFQLTDMQEEKIYERNSNNRGAGDNKRQDRAAPDDRPKEGDDEEEVPPVAEEAPAPKGKKAKKEPAAKIAQ